MERRNGTIWEDRLGYSGGRGVMISPVHQALGFEGLAGRTGRPPPTPGCWCCTQPRDVQDSGACHSTIPVALKALAFIGFPKGRLLGTVLFPGTVLRPPCLKHMIPLNTFWSSPCSLGSHPELTVVPWGWVPCSPSSAVGSRIQKSLSWVFLFQ